MAQSLRNGTDQGTRPTLWLAAVDGKRLPSPLEDVAPWDEPERLLEVEFEGITLEQQLSAIRGFPGGRRFVLKRRS